MERMRAVNEQDEVESYLRILDIPDVSGEGEYCENNDREQIIEVKRMKLDF